MSATDDLLASVGSFSDGASSAADYGAPAGNWAGVMQSAITLGGTYLSKRLDIDLAQRLAGMQPMPYRVGNQNLIPVGANGADLTTRGVQAVGGLRMGDLLPFLVVGLVAYMVLK